MKATNKDLARYDKACEEEAKKRGYHCFWCWHMIGPGLEAHEWSIKQIGLSGLSYNLRDGWQRI